MLEKGLVWLGEALACVEIVQSQSPLASGAGSTPSP